jgi:hypothetical protein
MIDYPFLPHDLASEKQRKRQKNGHPSRILSVEECGSGIFAAKAVALCGQKNRKAQKNVRTIHPWSESQVRDAECLSS